MAHLKLNNMGVDKRYVNIPYTILKRKDIGDKAKMVYGLIKGFWGGQCVASDSFLGKTLGCSTRTAQRAIRELKEMGLIWSNKRYDGKLCVGRTLIIRTKKADVRKHRKGEAQTI